MFFIPHSPRWLLSKDREEEAVACLQRLRNNADLDEGRCDEEIRLIKETLRDQVHKGPWLDLFHGTNLRRTFLVFAFYFFQQVCLSAIVLNQETG